MVGRAKVYLSYLAKRCRRKNLPMTLTQEWIMQKLTAGRCEQTDIAFNFHSLPNSNRSPWAFSIDRIDPSFGYTIENSQCVVWAYNAAKGEGTDADVYFMAKCMLGIIPQAERGELQSMPASRKVPKIVIK